MKIHRSKTILRIVWGVIRITFRASTHSGGYLSESVYSHRLVTVLRFLPKEWCWESCGKIWWKNDQQNDSHEREVEIRAEWHALTAPRRDQNTYKPTKTSSKPECKKLVVLRHNRKFNMSPKNHQLKRHCPIPGINCLSNSIPVFLDYKCCKEFHYKL